MDFWHQYYSNPGEQGYSPALEPEETQQRQLTHRSMRTLGKQTGKEITVLTKYYLCEQIKAFQMCWEYGI
jgi:hypothetical protein